MNVTMTSEQLKTFNLLQSQYDYLDQIFGITCAVTTAQNLDRIDPTWRKQIRQLTKLGVCWIQKFWEENQENKIVLVRCDKITITVTNP